MSVTLSVGNIEYPSITSTVTIQFSNAIGDININSFITNYPSTASVLSTMTTSDNGITWTGTLTGTTGYVVKNASMSINYTGGLNASDNYNILMEDGMKNWEEVYSQLDVEKLMSQQTLTCNKAGTMFAVDVDAYNYNLENGTYPRVEVYEYNGTTWNRKGGDVAALTENRYQRASLNESGDHVIVNISHSGGGTNVYKWNNNNWELKGSFIQNNVGGTIPTISNDGNTIGILLSTGYAYVYEYDTNTDDWVLKGQEIDQSAGTGYGTGQMSFSEDFTRFTFNKGYNIFTYVWNSGTSLWDLDETIFIEYMSSNTGVIKNYGGDIFAIGILNIDNNERFTKVYEWNGTEHVQKGTDITSNRDLNSVSLDSTGLKILIQRSHEEQAQIYDFEGSDWTLKKQISVDENGNYGAKKAIIDGDGNTIFFGSADSPYVSYDVFVYEEEITKKLNEISMTPSEIKFPDSTGVLKLDFGVSNLTSTEVATNVSISDVNLGSLGAFVSSEGGFIWTSTFAAANIEGSGTVDYSYSGMTGSLALVIDTLEKAISNICFYGNAQVLTNEGYKEIREVKQGMKVQGEEIEEVTRTINKEKEIVLMKKGCIMNNMPTEDTRITKEHKVLYKGKMVEARTLVNYETIVYEEYKGETLYNVLLSGEGKMVVNGMIVETLSPSNNIARLYKILKDYKEEDKKEIIKIYNEERREKSVDVRSK